MAVTLVQNFLTGIADAGRELLEIRRAGTKGPDLRNLCDDLLTQKGEALGTALARELITAYQQLDAEGRQQFFTMLNEDFAPDPDAVDAAIAAYQQAPGPATTLALGRATESPRRRLLRAFNMAPGGTAAVVEMREHLFEAIEHDAGLRAVDADFVETLSAWFNRGFLRLARIDWQTPAHILEKLIHYESVHEIHGWDDLRRRLDSDRRCFAFFHPALVDEPLVFVEVALCSGLATAIQPLLDRDGPRDLPTNADTAIFYSINNCQVGLRGISFGNFLIKQVVTELLAEIPSLKQFATLSPVPRFARWLEKVKAENDPQSYGMSAEQFAELDLLSNANWYSDPERRERLKKPLLRLCSHYLVRAKHGDRPMDRVSRFHLGNGAQLEQINWLGDISENGIARSHGILVNYRYDMKKIVENHEAYQASGEVVFSRSVQRQLPVLKT